MKRSTPFVLAGLATLAAATGGCGGGQKTSQSGLNEMAREAPAPLQAKPEKRIERDVSKAAQKDFAEAVAFFQEQAKGGWTRDECTAAARKFESVAETYDKLIEARFNAGLAYQSCGAMKDAERQYQAALKINSGHGASLANLGKIYFAGGNEARARQYWEQAIAANIQTASAHTNLAWLLVRDIQQGKAQLRDVEKTALNHLQRALAVENDNIEAYVVLALLYMEGSDKNKSRLTISKLVLDKGKKCGAMEGVAADAGCEGDKFAPLHNALGLLALKQDQVAESLGHFLKAVELDPALIEARMNVGNIVLGFRKYDEAAANFDAVLKLSPRSYDAMIGLGVAKRGLKDLDGAESAYKKAGELDSVRPEAFYNLGVLYKDFRANKTQDLKAAQSMYEQAIRFFRQAMSKPRVTAELQKEARENVEDCEKNIKSLDEAIRNQANQPKAAPAPEPAAPSTQAPTQPPASAPAGQG